MVSPIRLRPRSSGPSGERHHANNRGLSCSSPPQAAKGATASKGLRRTRLRINVIMVSSINGSVVMPVVNVRIVPMRVNQLLVPMAVRVRLSRGIVGLV
jgi:hypothetical protein